MKGKTVRNILSIWIFIALVVLGVGLALFINKFNSAPEDSKASALAGATIELQLKQRTSVSQDHQNLFNKGESVGFNVNLKTLPSGTYNKLVLRVQYAKANFDPAVKLFNVNSNTYNVLTTETSCTPIDANFDCKRVDIEKKTGNFVPEEGVAEINLVTKSLTLLSNNNVLIFPKNSSDFNGSMYSYLINNSNIADPYIFDTSVEAQRYIRIEDQCFGDYNRIKGAAGDIVDSQDLARFMSLYNIKSPLQGADGELDIDNRGNSKNILDDADLAIFENNFGLTTCNRNKSDGLPL